MATGTAAPARPRRVGQRALAGPLAARHANINDAPAAAADRKFHGDRSGPRQAGHPGRSDLGL